MLVYMYILVLFMIGYIFLYLHLTILEAQFIQYRSNVDDVLLKINAKFEIFEDNELYNLELMNKRLDNITL